VRPCLRPACAAVVARSPNPAAGFAWPSPSATWLNPAGAAPRSPL